MDETDSPAPGLTADRPHKPDNGENSDHGSDRQDGMAALITGGDSGIGRTMAIAFAREGADLAFSYLNEQENAENTRRHIPEAGRRHLLLPGDISDSAHRDAIMQRMVEDFGKSTPMGRPAQPVDLVSTFVMLAEPPSACVSGATVSVTGGTPFL